MTQPINRQRIQELARILETFGEDEQKPLLTCQWTTDERTGQRVCLWIASGRFAAPPADTRFVP